MDQIINKYFTNFAKILKPRQADKFHSVEKKKSLRLIKEYYGEERITYQSQ